MFPNTASSLSATSSIADFLEELPHFASEEEDWKAFGYLLDCGKAFYDDQADQQVPSQQNWAASEEEDEEIGGISFDGAFRSTMGGGIRTGDELL